MNIFVRELILILAAHEKKLSSLYSFHSSNIAIHQEKVRRLQRTLEGPLKESSFTLNGEEIAMLQEQVPLTDEEVRRLRAALLAESVRRLLTQPGRVSIDTAEELANIAFQMLLSTEGEQMQNLRDQLLEQVRSMQEALRDVIEEEAISSDVGEEQVSTLLEPAAEAYYQGVLWLELARARPDWLSRRGYAAHAKALLEAARDLARYAPSRALNTPEQATWLTLIEAALEDVSLLG